MATVMNEDQKQILAEAFDKAFEIIERNLMKVIDEKFDSIMDNKGETPDPDEVALPLSEDDVQTIVRDMINGGDITVSIDAD